MAATLPTPESDRQIRAALMLAAGVWVFLTATWVSTVAALALGLTVSGACVGVGVAATGAMLLLLREVPSRERVLAAARLAALLGLSLAAGGLWLDLSHDGMAYHQPAILALARGWNFYWDAPVPGGGASLWINHYPKAPWLVSAAIFRVIGVIEPSKAPGLLLMTASGSVAFAALRSAGLSGRASTVLAIVAAANPVTIGQLGTFYVDGHMASAFLTIVASLWLSRSARLVWLVRVPLVAAAAYAINVKFSGAVVVAVVVVAVLGASIVCATLRRTAAVLVACAVAGIVVLGFHPYVTNAVRAGHPFHPLYGARTVDIMSTQCDRAFVERTPPDKLVRSLLAQTSNASEPLLKVPLSLYRAEFAALASPDLRFGGFGPLFSAALVAALGLAWAAWRTAKPEIGVVVLCLLPLSGLANPEAWWARYAPQLWLIPIVVCAWALSAGPFIKRAAVITVALMGVNAIIVTIGSWEPQLRRSVRFRRELAAIAHASAGRPVYAEFEGLPSARLRLEEGGITVAADAPAECASRFELPEFPRMRVCVRSPPERRP